MLPIGSKYRYLYGDEAVERLVADLMAGDPDTLKAGYSRDNAIIAAAEAFGITRDEVEEQLS